MSNGKRKFPPIALVIFCVSFVVYADGMASHDAIGEEDWYAATLAASP